MATLRLSGQLQSVAGAAEHDVSGATVGDALAALERATPPLAGWILDERREIRRHINVFVDGERASARTPLRVGATIHVLPSITGGGR